EPSLARDEAPRLARSTPLHHRLGAGGEPQRLLVLQEEGQRGEQEGGVGLAQALDARLLGLVVLGADRAFRDRDGLGASAREGIQRGLGLARGAGVAGSARDEGQRLRGRRDPRRHEEQSESGEPCIHYPILARSRYPNRRLRDTGEPRAASFFRRVIGARYAVLAVYALALVPAARLASRIPHDDAIDRMIVESDPDVAATRAFHALFPERKSMLVLAETDDPFSPASLDGLEKLEAALGRLPDVATVSAPAIAERMRPGLRARPEEL